uniref:Cytochrome b5 heme-binding domain-containing protein n=1 Tax=Caenorhabditis japonica TaxID=281687 RepID=A0A8R1IXU7_CAEJA
MANTSKNLKEYTRSDVEQHCTHDDLWISFRGKVYNMTPYFNEHPGGLAILRYAGKDTTTILPFVASHGIAWKFIEKKLEEHLIGTLKITPRRM